MGSQTAFIKTKGGNTSIMMNEGGEDSKSENKPKEVFVREDMVYHNEEDNTGRRWISVTTNNVKEVTWPPTNTNTSYQSRTSGPMNLNKDKRKKLDEEFSSISSQSVTYSSHPFTSGLEPKQINSVFRSKENTKDENKEEM